MTAAKPGGNLRIGMSCSRNRLPAVSPSSVQTPHNKSSPRRHNDPDHPLQILPSCFYIPLPLQLEFVFL